MSWRSNLNGFLGTGSLLTNNDLSIGSHTITLVAADHQGTTGSDSISITVSSNVGNSPPTARIIAPSDNSHYVKGDLISLEGFATDPEEGNLAGDSLVWLSDIDGQLGTGSNLKVSLSVNTHIITLTAWDHQGASGGYTIRVTVTSNGKPSGSEGGGGCFIMLVSEF